jgi:antitoxin component YwqK of YwqJK toxin-antitoxin module
MTHIDFFLKIIKKTLHAISFSLPVYSAIFELKFLPMKKLPVLFLFFLYQPAGAQYYYKDLMSIAETTQLMKTYSATQVKKVTATGITPGGATASDFNETYDISPDGTSLRITTRINQTVSSILHRFSSNGRLLSTVDSSSGLKSISLYTYDEKGRVISISNSITDTDTASHFTQTEIHQYIYKDDKPDKMWRIINQADSLEVRFVTDENGNIVEERNFRRNTSTDPIYYYYDDRNRLTDIVRYNYKAKRLLPDYLFEYDDKNRVIQKITTLGNDNMGYLTWRYLYNDKGLKTKEALFDKEKQLKGRIDYTYN